jgi:ribosomal protein L35
MQTRELITTFKKPCFCLDHGAFETTGLAKSESSIDREISSVEAGSETGIVDASYCKSSVWFALPRDERKKILVARDKDRKGSKNRWKRNGEGKMVRRGNGKGSGSSIGDGKSKRKLAALVSESN